MLRLVLLGKCLILEFLGSKANVIASHTSSVIEIESLLIIPEVVFQFLLKYPLREWEGDFCLIAIGFIHLPRGFESCPVFFFEDMVRINNEVIEIIRCTEHRHGNIIIVSARILQIDFLTMISNRTELKFDLLCHRLVFLGTQFISGRGHIDQSSNET